MCYNFLFIFLLESFHQQLHLKDPLEVNNQVVPLWTLLLAFHIECHQEKFTFLANFLKRDLVTLAEYLKQQLHNTFRTLLNFKVQDCDTEVFYL